MERYRGSTLVFTALLVLLLILSGTPGRWSGPAGAAHIETSFTAPYNISNSAENNTQHPRALVAPDNYLHATWMEGYDDPYPKANGPAYTKGQTTSWLPWEWAAAHNNQGYTNPSIALDSAGTVHIAWAASSTGGSPYDVWYAYKPAGGSWSAAQNLSSDDNNTVYPDIACDSLGNIWVVWQVTYSNGDTDVNGRYKPAGGSWGNVVEVANSAAQDQNPRIAIDSANVPHVVWRNSSGLSAKWDIFYSRYVDGHWTGASNISANSTQSYYPDIAAYGLNLYVVWEDDIDGPDVFQIVSRRWDGATWLAWEQVSLSSKALFPAVAANSTLVYATWQDYRGGGAPEIYFSYSSDAGANWQANENVSHNGTTSYYPDIAAQAGGLAHIFWEDRVSSGLDIFYSRASTGAEPPPEVPPSGEIAIRTLVPPDDPLYTGQLTVSLQLTATSPMGRPISTMRICNVGDCTPKPTWIPYATTVPSWTLLDTPYDCEYKYVQAWFMDNGGLESITATAVILYDGAATATMALNDDNAWTNRLTVTVVSADGEAADPDCSGLEALRLSQDGTTYSDWMPFTSTVDYLLASGGPLTRTVYAEYRDRAQNTLVLTDQIALDTIPPYSPTAPTMPTVTAAMMITVTGLSAQDDESGMARVWMSNQDGRGWVPFDYAPPPQEYRWSLAYGAPPPTSPVTLTVYVRYEDDAGYGDYPGNYSAVLSSTIRFEGVVYSIYLPLIGK